jgi:hypothetical protein
MIKIWIEKLKALRIYAVSGSASRYFIFAATFELDKYKTATQNFGHVRKTNFPTITNLKDVVRLYNKDAFNIVILSVCEVKEDEFKRFFSEQD